MKVVINNELSREIVQYYYNVAKKFCNTVGQDDVNNWSIRAIREMFNVETLQKCNNSIIDDWKPYTVVYSKVSKWYYAYHIENGTIKIEGARHQNNMSNRAFRYKKKKKNNKLKLESFIYGISYDKNISELTNFHSWMNRLDEVKGARPTFWIEG